MPCLFMDIHHSHVRDRLTFNISSAHGCERSRDDRACEDTINLHTMSILTLFNNLDPLALLASLVALVAIWHLIPYFADKHGIRANNVSGPLLARFTDAWLGLVALRGHRSEAVHELHQKYGESGFSPGALRYYGGKEWRKTISVTRSSGGRIKTMRLAFVRTKSSILYTAQLLMSQEKHDVCFSSNP
jgi:hypothetical protein